MYSVYCNSCETKVTELEVEVIVYQNDIFDIDIRTGNCECVDEKFSRIWTISYLLGKRLKE